MVIGEQPKKQNGEEVEQDTVDGQNIVPTNPNEPPTPKDMDAEVSQELRCRAAKAVEQLNQATGTQPLDLVTSIGSVGTQAQRAAATEMEPLRARFGEVLTSEKRYTKPLGRCKWAMLHPATDPGLVLPVLIAKHPC